MPRCAGVVQARMTHPGGLQERFTSRPAVALGSVSPLTVSSS